MVIRFYQAVYQTLTSIRNLFRVKVDELLNGRHSAVRINMGSVAVKKSFGVIGIHARLKAFCMARSTLVLLF